MSWHIIYLPTNLLQHILMDLVLEATIVVVLIGIYLF